MLGNFDAPYGWDTPAPLPPFGTRGLVNTEAFGVTIDIRPSKICHDERMGQFVPFVKDNMSRVFHSGVGQNSAMAKDSSKDTKSEFKAAMIARVAYLRKSRNWTQEMMADALGIEMETYKKYETRSLLAHDLISRFAQLVDRDADYVLTGKTAPRRIADVAAKRSATG